APEPAEPESIACRDRKGCGPDARERRSDHAESPKCRDRSRDRSRKSESTPGHRATAELRPRPVDQRTDARRRRRPRARRISDGESGCCAERTRQMSFGVRRLASAFLILLTGCSFFSRTKSQIYSLDRIPGTVVNVHGVPIGINSIELPPGFDRKEVVARKANNQLDVRATQQWSAPLGQLVL